jgi:hypothetical protein
VPCLAQFSCQCLNLLLLCLPHLPKLPLQQRSRLVRLALRGACCCCCTLQVTDVGLLAGYFRS